MFAHCWNAENVLNLSFFERACTKGKFVRMIVSLILLKAYWRKTRFFSCLRVILLFPLSCLVYTFSLLLQHSWKKSIFFLRLLEHWWERNFPAYTFSLLLHRALEEKKIFFFACPLVFTLLLEH